VIQNLYAEYVEPKQEEDQKDPAEKPSIPEDPDELSSLVKAAVANFIAGEARYMGIINQSLVHLIQSLPHNIARALKLADEAESESGKEFYLGLAERYLKSYLELREFSIRQEGMSWINVKINEAIKPLLRSGEVSFPSMLMALGEAKKEVIRLSDGLDQSDFARELPRWALDFRRLSMGLQGIITKVPELHEGGVLTDSQFNLTILSFTQTATISPFSNKRAYSQCLLSATYQVCRIRPSISIR